MITYREGNHKRHICRSACYRKDPIGIAVRLWRCYLLTPSAPAYNCGDRSFDRIDETDRVLYQSRKGASIIQGQGLPQPGPDHSVHCASLDHREIRPFDFNARGFMPGMLVHLPYGLNASMPFIKPDCPQVALHHPEVGAFMPQLDQMPGGRFQ